MQAPARPEGIVSAEKNPYLCPINVVPSMSDQGEFRPAAEIESNMDLNEIGEELRQLSKLVAGWNSGGDIAALERDLALEKLRRLYDMLCFPKSASRPERNAEPPEEVPVNLDLDEMLGMMPLPDGAEPELRTVEGESPRAAGMLVGQSVPVEAVTQKTVPSRAADAAVSAARVAPDSETVPVSETPGVQISPDGEPVSSLRQAEGTAEPAVPAPEAVVPEKDAGRESASKADSANPTVIEPALFGLEEIVRHKRKQRVIMSLYDDPSEVVRETIPERKEPVRKAGSEPFAKKREIPPVPQTVKNVDSSAGAGSESESVPEKNSVASAGPAVWERSTADSGSSTRIKAADAEVPTPDPVSDATRETRNTISAAVPGAVLGEVINQGMQTLGETLAPPRDSLSDRAHRTPVTDLREAIGINDKFLLIRDLFDGDAEACERTIDVLNGFGDLDQCMIHIAEHYAWNPNSDGAKLLAELLERKFS